MFTLKQYRPGLVTSRPGKVAYANGCSSPTSSRGIGWIESVVCPLRRPLWGGARLCRRSSVINDTKTQIPLRSVPGTNALCLALDTLKVTTSGFSSFTPAAIRRGGATASSMSYVCSSTSGSGLSVIGAAISGLSWLAWVACSSDCGGAWLPDKRSDRRNGLAAPVSLCYLRRWSHLHGDVLGVVFLLLDERPIQRWFLCGARLTSSQSSSQRLHLPDRPCAWSLS